jgi:predicted HicB family RNase H-like nuclease
MQWSGKRPLTQLRYLDAEQNWRAFHAAKAEKISLNAWVVNAINAALAKVESKSA